MGWHGSRPDLPQCFGGDPSDRSIGVFEAAATAGTASAAGGPIFPRVSKDAFLTAELFASVALIKADKARFSTVPVAPNSWIA